MINSLLNQLIAYAKQENLLKTADVEYATNQLLYLFRQTAFVPETLVGTITFFPVMDALLSYAVQTGIIGDTDPERDNFEGKLMDVFLPRPSELDRKFQTLYQASPMAATQYFFELSQKSNYIKTSRIAKNITYKYEGKYAPLDITINLSKPEKDPKLIALQSLFASEQYPKCALCMENVGFYGTLEKAPRSNHRVINLTLHHEINEWGFQYSPYAYFNEHCIVLKKAHIPMKVDAETFAELIDFVNQFPHYLIGSNAGLPIVGGSILNHYHFQGGRYAFPIEAARVLKKWKKRHVDVELLDWPLSVIRIVGENENHVLDMVNRLFEAWKTYDNPMLSLFSHTSEDHNTVTPIVNIQNGKYQFYVVLRNNRATEERPYGIFHPRESLFHIKKENIGLIEVMGLAVLPGRLESELREIADCLKSNTNPSTRPALVKHATWISGMKPTGDITTYLRQEVGRIFELVLEDCGVFKSTDYASFERFVEDAIN